MSDEKPKFVTFRDLKVKPATTSTPSLPSTSSPTSTPRTTSRPSTARKVAVAPERDFQRIPNSVTRHAVPERVFRGKSKQVYDYLWSVSRGAIVPNRSVRKSRKEIQKGSGLGSMVTVDAAIDHLQRVGMIRVRPAIGSLVGNEYEVFTYEESSPSSTSTPSTSSPTQNLVELDALESSTTRATQAVDFKEQGDSPKTSFNTKEQKLDDERVPRPLASTERELTGKNAPADKWAEVWEVLETELRIAAGRTTVSSVPAFLAEHLRRRLFKKDKRQLEQESVSEGQQAQKASIPEGATCPDCFNTGMWYPEGFERGVARCHHEKLSKTTEGN